MLEDSIWVGFGLFFVLAEGCWVPCCFPLQRWWKSNRQVLSRCSQEPHPRSYSCFQWPMTFKKGCFPWGDDYYYLEGGPTQSGFCLKVLGLKFPLTKRCKLWHFLGIQGLPLELPPQMVLASFKNEKEWGTHWMCSLPSHCLSRGGAALALALLGIQGQFLFFFTWSHTDCTTHQFQKGFGLNKPQKYMCVLWGNPPPTDSKSNTTNPQHPLSCPLSHYAKTPFWKANGELASFALAGFSSLSQEETRRK